MKVLFLDIESTGLCEPEHRIIEFYGAIHDLTTEVCEAVLDIRIDPERSISAEAHRVHGIGSMDLAGKPKFPDAAILIAAIMEMADLYVGHNGDAFDLKFLDQEFTRVGLTMPNRPSFDTMNCRWSTPSGKVPNLGELALGCDVPYDPAKAHAASYDVTVMTSCFFRAYRWGWIDLSPKT